MVWSRGRINRALHSVSEVGEGANSGKEAIGVLMALGVILSDEFEVL